MFGSRHRSAARQRRLLARRRFALEVLEQRRLLTLSDAGADHAILTLGAAPGEDWATSAAVERQPVHAADALDDDVASTSNSVDQSEPQPDSSANAESLLIEFSSDLTTISQLIDPLTYQPALAEPGFDAAPSDDSTGTAIPPAEPVEAAPPLDGVAPPPPGLAPGDEPAPVHEPPPAEPLPPAEPPPQETPPAEPLPPPGGPWNAASVPRVASDDDANGVELGLRFSPTVAGAVAGVRFYKGAANTGRHLAHLWTSDGTLLASAVFLNETESGWQQVCFANPVVLTPGREYVVSYYAPNGGYALDVGYFAYGFRNGLLDLPANAGVFAYGEGNVAPAESWLSSHYWVDVLFAADASSETPPNASTGQLTETVGLNGVGTPPDLQPSAFAATTYTATAQSLLYWLDQTYGLDPVGGDDDLNRRGLGEKDLTGLLAPSAGGDGSLRSTYYLLPNGDLYHVQGSAAAGPAGVLVAHLGEAVYHDPSRLWNAVDATIPVALTLVGDQLTIQPSPGYEGTFVVTATLSDGRSSLVRPFLVAIYADHAVSTSLIASAEFDSAAAAAEPNWDETSLKTTSLFAASFDFDAAATAPTNPPLTMTVTPIVPVGSSLFERSLARWEAQMLEYGRPYAAEIHAQADESGLGLTYYDSAWIFQRIADYTGDSSWLQAADDSLRVYRDAYVAPSAGVVPGYWNFTGGLAANALRTGDAASRDAVLALASNVFGADSTPESWTESWEMSREVAYSLMANLDAEELGAAHRARTDVLANQALGHLAQWTVSQSARYVKPFMVALTCEALIAYQARTGDPRVLPAVVTALDWLWDHCWNASACAFVYTSAPIPEEGEIDPGPAPDLNLLIAPVFGWVYHQTGEALYRDRGDAVFAGGVDQSWLTGVKQFNQNYRWSFDYVTWRSEPPLRNP